GLKRVEAVQSDLHEAGIDGANLAFNMTWHDWLNLRSLVDVSEVIARAALERENSRGAHFREDFPEVGDLESSYFTLAQKRGEDLALSRAEVAFTIVRPGQTVLPDDAPATLVAAQ